MVKETFDPNPKKDEELITDPSIVGIMMDEDGNVVRGIVPSEGLGWLSDIIVEDDSSDS